MYNLRYHIASLVAVFLALAVGLLLGTIVVERGVLNAQRTTLVEGLQKDFNQIRSESAATKKANDALVAFAGETAPKIVESALASRTVLIIASPDTADTVATVSRAVHAAGGSTAIATFSGPKLALGDSAVSAAAAKSLGVPVASLDTTTVVAALAREWSTVGDPRALTKVLIAAGGLKLTGLAANGVVQGVVVSATFSGSPDSAALGLAGALFAPAVPGVGVETTKRTDGTAGAAHKLGLSGVDDVDSAMGEVSLAWVLSGRASGFFGAGAGVDGPYPTPLFPSP